ncbi:MAG TPA: T9SS type A sorting domain-containing protein [Saprospiraceae bacterium]|nr:T9SS type A sorting domain-containing protein [Saprospiraceae bacterium]
MRNVNKLLRVFLFVITPFLFVQAQDCNNTTVITLTGPGVFDWTAPATGGPFSVRITATGAGGGANTGNFNNPGGSGAIMSGTFTVQNGQTLRAIAGDFGKDATLEGAGGGGGSGVVNCGNPSNCAGGTIMIIAAGGNGGGATEGLGGSELTDGNGAGGLAGGEPTHEPDWGGGGGGLLTDGQNSSGSGGLGGKKVDKTGLSLGGLGSGSQVPNDGGSGMGGGGGGGDFGEGGGGGHTGGAGGNGTAAKSANIGTSQDNTPGTQGGGNNLGTITAVCLEALPVEMTSFKAMIPLNGGVHLLWATATEKDNQGFDVERSADGRNWASIGFVPGNGTTAIPQDYLFRDEKPLAGVNYYRLKQNDTNGKFEYSPMVVADVRKDDVDFNVFPNPSNDGMLSFRVVSKNEGAALLEIFDWAGYKLYKEPVRIFAGTTIWPVSLATYPKGAYTARLEMPDGTIQFKKIVLQ